MHPPGRCCSTPRRKAGPATEAADRLEDLGGLPPPVFGQKAVKLAQRVLGPPRGAEQHRVLAPAVAMNAVA